MGEPGEGTVDPKQTEFFHVLSKDWWENDGIQMLKILNTKVIVYIVEQLKKIGFLKKPYENTSTPLEGLKVLEVGCGGGLVCEALARTGCQTTGIDPNVQLVQVAKTHASADASLSKIDYVAETVEEYCEKNAGKFDVVIANFVLEHVNNQEYFIKCCAKCVKPGGSLFLSTVGKTYLAWFFIIVLPEYILKILPKGLHEFDKFMDASNTEDFIRSNGFKVVHTQGLFYDFFMKAVYWFPFHSIMYITHSIRKM